MMGLSKARQRMVMLKKELPAPVYAGNEKPQYESEGQLVFATLQPYTQSVNETIQGEGSDHTLRMITTPDIPLKKGMGVCVDSSKDDCDYRIQKPIQKWTTHQEAILTPIV